MKSNSFVLKLFSWIFGIIIALVLLATAICATIYFVWGINVFQTANQIIILQQSVDQSKYDNQFDQTDMQSAKQIFDQNIGEIITYDPQTGYSIDIENLSGLMTSDLYLDAKQCGALVNCLLKQNGGLTVQIYDIDIPTSVIQIKFENLVENCVDFNVVLKLDIKPAKEKMTEQPIKFLSKYIPDTLFISATGQVKKDQGTFCYTISTKDIEINNLDSSQTANFLETLNKFTKIGNSTDLNQTIVNPVVNILIGNSDTKGLALGLRAVGAGDFEFAIQGQQIYFVITKK